MRCILKLVQHDTERAQPVVPSLVLIRTISHGNTLTRSSSLLRVTITLRLPAYDGPPGTFGAYCVPAYSSSSSSRSSTIPRPSTIPDLARALLLALPFPDCLSRRRSRDGAPGPPALHAKHVRTSYPDGFKETGVGLQGITQRGETANGHCQLL